MRTLALVAACAALAGCVSAEAARRVRIVGARPPASCPVVEARLRGRGDNANAALRDLRRRAVRSGATDVVVTDGPRQEWDATATVTQPWTAGNMQVVDAIGYACAGPTAP
jgi:hypothetical protein